MALFYKLILDKKTFPFSFGSVIMRKFNVNSRMVSFQMKQIKIDTFKNNLKKLIFLFQFKISKLYAFKLSH